VPTLVSIALPEERRRIRELLNIFPGGLETKTSFLINALKQLWQVSPQEKVVVFTTYLGSVAEIKEAVEKTLGDKGVEVLKGGDHGAKLAAQRRFRRKNGPQLLLCTAAGREGINLQFARVLFNYDLPWNPMDLEQRIGRIHRYGQKYTAQVYNLVASDTIEGKIFLLLEEKLYSIAQTLGKMDESGQVAEDFRSQVLGQLGSRLSYDRLYQEAILDPTLKRTRQELEVAITNANLAREVVFELFQDLDKFNLSDYQQFDDMGKGMQRLVIFVQRAANLEGGDFRRQGEDVYSLTLPGLASINLTTNRDRAIQEENLDLLGLEHNVVRHWIDKYAGLRPEDRAFIGNIGDNGDEAGFITIWQVIIHGPGGQVHQRLLRLGMTPTGERSPYMERLSRDLLQAYLNQRQPVLPKGEIIDLLNGSVSKLLHRELGFSGSLPEGASYSSRLLAFIDVMP
jgi:hypothetical protein